MNIASSEDDTTTETISEAKSEEAALESPVEEASNTQSSENIADFNGATSTAPVAESTPDNPRYADWKNHYPGINFTKPKELIPLIDLYASNIRQTMAMKEILMLARIDQSIHVSYYSMWARDTNAFFRILVRLKERKKILLAAQKKMMSHVHEPQK